MTETIKEPKKTIRTRKTVISSVSSEPQTTALLNPLIAFLTSLATHASTLKDEVVTLQKSMNEVRDSWRKEQLQHEEDMRRRDETLAMERQREEEEYTYRKMMDGKKAEDAFAEKKATWEKELADQKETIGMERRELTDLRKKVAAFDDEVAKAVKKASESVTEELEEKAAFEEKLREQEVKSEKEMLALKITTLVKDNSVLTTETERLKKAFDEATHQLKEVALKVIEGRTPKQELTHP